MKTHFEKETYMCVVNKQDSQFPGSHWVMVYQDKKKRPISLIFLEETMASSSRDLFAKYPEDCNA